MVIEARLNDISSSQVTVTVRVRQHKKPKQSIDEFKFTRKNYSVIIPTSILKRQKILHLGVRKPARAANETVKYKLKTDTKYFTLNSKDGSLAVAKNLKSKGNQTVTLRVKAIIRGKFNYVTETTISVSIVPDYIGNQFVDSSLKVVNNKTSKSIDKLSERSRSGAAEFRVHRMFRTLSPEARRISAADVKFNSVIRSIKRKVAERILGMYDYFLLLDQ